MIPVTKVRMPDKKTFLKYVDKIYENGWITNSGPLVQEFEKKLADFLGVRNVVLVANGTTALEIAYRTLGLNGDVITTPFSAVATTSSLVAAGLNPIFVDIDPETFSIDVDKIEEKITPETTAIVPVHIFGYPCQIEAIEKIAKKHDLKVIYDAAHAFNIDYKNESILNHGDISILSFHATKIFHSIEGGALIINDDSLVEKAHRIVRFGFEDAETVKDLGINGRMNEFEAAMGLTMLEEISEVISLRKIIHDRYRDELKDIVTLPRLDTNATLNYSYFPVVFKDEKEMRKVRSALEKHDIYPRRYFYPSLDTLPYIEPKQFCPISRDICSRILALPLYSELLQAEQDIIIQTIKNTI